MSVKSRVLTALGPIEGRRYNPGQAVEFPDRLAKSLAAEGSIDTAEAAVEYALSQGELIVHKALQPEAEKPAQAEQPATLAAGDVHASKLSELGIAVADATAQVAALTTQIKAAATADKKAISEKLKAAQAALQDAAQQVVSFKAEQVAAGN